MSRTRSNAVSEVMSVQLSVCVRIAALRTVISLWERWGICCREFIHLNEIYEQDTIPGSASVLYSYV